MCVQQCFLCSLACHWLKRLSMGRLVICRGLCGLHVQMQDLILLLHVSNDGRFTCTLTGLGLLLELCWYWYWTTC